MLFLLQALILSKFLSVQARIKMLEKIKKCKIYLLFTLFSSMILLISACMYISSERVSNSTKTSVSSQATKPLKETSKPTKKPTISTSAKSSMSNFAPAKSLEALRKKIEADKDFKVRIFGDSHMAADFFSRELRKLLIDVNAIGFVYPLQPRYQQALIMDYESKNFELFNSQNDGAQDYGLGGVIARAKSADAFIKLSPNLLQNVFNITISFKSAQNGTAFVIKDAKNKEFKLVSKSTEFSQKELKNLTFPITIAAKQKNTELAGYFISNDKDNKIIDTLGINGAPSNLWMKWNEKLVKSQLQHTKSDLIILAYGSNDALIGNFDKQKFKSEYKNFIQILRQTNPKAAIFLIAPPTVTQKESGVYKLSSDFYAVQEALYELAKEEKLTLFDMHSFIEASGGKDKWIQEGLSKEDVHLKIEGYQLMAQQFYKDLSELLKLKKR